MKEKNREQVFVERVVSALDKSTRDLDAGTVSRLRSIRVQAQEAGRAGVRTGWRSFFRLPAAGLATAAVVLVAGIFYFGLPMGGNHHKGVEDVEILATTDNLEFYEDLDFYRWLTEEAHATEKDSLFRNSPSLQYARIDSPLEAVTGPGRGEKSIGRAQPFPWPA